MKVIKIKNRFQIFFLIFIPIISQESKIIIKLKVNQEGPLQILNNINITLPDEIYIDNEIKGKNVNNINIDNIESEIKLVWFNKFNTCYSMFANISYITEIDFSEFDSSDVTNMQYMFYNCTSLKSLNLSNLNTSNVISMSYMFAYCISLTSLNVSSFDTSKVQSMQAMFGACHSLESLDLSNFNTESNQNFVSTFLNCYKLKNINLNGVITNSTIGFNFMFTNCYSLTYLNLSSFGCKNNLYFVVYAYMFCNCTSLISLDLSNIAPSDFQLMIMTSMFEGCKNLRYVNLEKYNYIGNNDYYYNMFDGTPDNLVICYQIMEQLI